MTSGSGRFSSSTEAPRRRAAGVVAVLALGAAALLAPPLAAQVEEEDITASLAEYRAMLEEAQGLLDSLELAPSIDVFTRLIEAYKSGRIPMMTPDAGQIVTAAYEGRALALANLGRNDEATADFEALIRLDPSYTIDLEGISPKIVALFTGAKKRLVGVLQVETDPLGAEVTVDGASVGPSPVMDREILVGTHLLRIAREGFDPVEEEIVVEPAARVERQVKLVPNARGIRVATSPRDVRVLVDGEEKGSTFGRAGAEYEEVAAELGLSLADISEPLLVPNLSPGAHVITLRRDCFEEVKVDLTITVDPNDNAPVAYKPFVLNPSRGSLKVDSTPSGSQVYLDGSLAGKAPLRLDGLCSGPHQLRMELEGLGRVKATVKVLKDQVVEVSRPLKLSLAAFEARPGAEAGRDLAAALEGVERYNLLGEGKGIDADTAQRVRLEVQSTRGKGLGTQSLAELFDTLDVELIALAVPAGALGDRTDFLLYGPIQDEPDRWPLEGSGPEAFRRVVAALNRDLEVTEPWSGVKLIDVRGEENPVVSSLTPGGPAESAGIRPGEFLVTAGGAALGSAADFAAVLAKSRPGSELVVGVRGPEGGREVKVTLRSTPVMLPPRSDSTLYNKAIVDLRQAAEAADGDSVAAGYAWLNVGMALMHFGQYEAAIREGFRKAQLPDAAGISMGTVQYLTGLAYERLGLQREAREAYQKAAASPYCTAGTHDGPLLAPSARRRMDVLGESR